MSLNPEVTPEKLIDQPKVDVTLQKPPEQNKTNESENNKATVSPGIAEASYEDPNWKAFREARKKDRENMQAAEKRAREKEAEAEALKAAMEAAFARQQPIPAQQQNYSDHYPHEETEDERIEKKVQAAIAAKEAQYESMRHKREQEEYPQRLVKNYPDFNQTISQDNLDYLDYHYPEVSNPLQRLQDDYLKWEDIYKAVKKFVPNNSTAKKDAMRAESNQFKPKSISSPTITQPVPALAPQHEVEAKRAANWERMQRIIKGVGQ